MRGFLLHTFDKRSTQHLKNISEVTHIHSASTWPSQDSISDSLSTTVHTACIHRGPAASPIYWKITGKSRHSHPCASSQKIPSFCRVPRCLQTLFLQNFILAIGLTHEVKLGYCGLIHYAFCAIHEWEMFSFDGVESVWKKLTWLASQPFLQHAWLFHGSLPHSLLQQALFLRLHWTQP